MSKYICKLCGKEFDRVGNGVYCPGPHFRPCPVCGKPVAYQRPSEPHKCCSKECAYELAAQSKQSKPMRQCEECGKMFVPVQASQRYCKGPHITLCEVCGKEISYTCSPRDKPRHCSQECINAAHVATVRGRYNVDNVSELQEVKDKISKKNSSLEVREKRAQTCLIRMGVDNPAKHPEIKRKLSAVMRSDRYLNGRRFTCTLVYGHPSPMQNDEVKAKKAYTYRQHYGPEGRKYTAAELANIMTDPSKADVYAAFKSDPRDFVLTHYTEKPTMLQLMTDLGVTDTTIYDILVKYDCHDIISHQYSQLECEVVDYIKQISPNVEIIQNDRSMITPHELDIYLPQYQIAFECNPAFTHNSSIGTSWGDKPKHYRYHQYKSEKAAEQGIFLFHIFGYEWKAHKDVIKSMIANLLGCTARRIGARETYVFEIPAAVGKEFLNSNHRQGALTSKVYIGLKLKSTDELVSVMTFNHLRNTIGKTTHTETNTWELSRFCNLINCSVVGGASKLFKYFLKHYQPDKVISFSDVAHTRGNLYQTLQFSRMYQTPPSYVWTTIDDNKYYHRVRCQKHNLISLFNDASIDIEHQTEKEIMEAHGFVRVYDSGVIKWVWSASTLNNTK